MPLRNANPVSFLATANAPESRAFYETIIGLELIEETDFALVFAVGNSHLRIQKVSQVSPPPYTSMGWLVKDIKNVVASLKERGVVLDFHQGLAQDENGIWTSPSCAKIAWFKDPDGNTLSLTQE